MFGFLASPCRCGVESGEAETYRGFFCGLANRLHADYGPLGRFLVNRDATFLSLMTAAQMDAGPEPVLTTCCNPLAAKRPRFQSGDHAGYAAAVTICGLTSKIRDEIEDSTGIRRPLFRAAEGLTRRSTRRAERLLEDRGFPVAEVQQKLSGQLELERKVAEGEADPASAAGPTRSAFGEIFGHSAHLADRPRNQDAARAIGEELGEAIYWFDAAVDFEEDRKKGRFNPLPDTGWQAGLGNRFETNFTRIRDAFSGLNLDRFQETLETVLFRLTPPRAFAAAGLELPASLGAVSFSATRRRNKRHRDSGKRRWWDNCCDGCCDCGCCCDGKGDGGCDACDCDCCPCDCSCG